MLEVLALCVAFERLYNSLVRARHLKARKARASSTGAPNEIYYSVHREGLAEVREPGAGAHVTVS